MARPTIIEVSDDEVRVRRSEQFFQRVGARSNIGPAYTGKYACFCAVVTNNALTEEQLDSLEQQINEIQGVFNSFVLVGSSRVPYDRLPASNPQFETKLEIGLEARFNMSAEPVEPGPTGNRP